MDKLDTEEFDEDDFTMPIRRLVIYGFIGASVVTATVLVFLLILAAFGHSA